jgi:peroxiredoxin
MESKSPHQRNIRRIIGLSLCAAAGIAGATAVWWHNSYDAAPDVRFIYLDGRKISLEQLRGKVVLVNFWSTSCAPCLKEMPNWVATYQQFKGDGLEVVAVAMHYDAPNYVIDYATSRKLPFPVTIDVNSQLAKAFGGVNATPASFLIDKQGKILQTTIGSPQFPKLHNKIRKALI